MNGANFSRAERIGRMLGLAYDRWQERAYNGMAARGFSDIRPAHSPVFRFGSPDGVRVVELAAKASMTKQSMGYLVEDLTKLDYVKIVPDPSDGRARLVQFTARGIAAEQALRELSTELEADLAKRLGAPQVEQLRVALRTICTTE